jgi:hypothetical protein
MQYFNDAVSTSVVFTVVRDVEGNGSCSLFYNTAMSTSILYTVIGKDLN